MGSCDGYRAVRRRGTLHRVYDGAERKWAMTRELQTLLLVLLMIIVAIAVWNYVRR